ncbi:hypothetical protein GGF31_008200 [Allomyces arbusculus]|nr:hypothetical protein GGF31_008200 [Allomyces arbusculus]
MSTAAADVDAPPARTSPAALALALTGALAAVVAVLGLLYVRHRRARLRIRRSRARVAAAPGGKPTAPVAAIARAISPLSSSTAHDCSTPLILAPAAPPATKLAAATEPVLPAPVKDVPLARAPHAIAQIAASQALAYTVYRGYLPRLNDELEVLPGDCVRVLAVFDDGWAWGDVVHRAPAPRPMGIFPLACLLAPNDDDEWISDDDGEEEAVESSSDDTPHRASPVPSDAVLTRPDSATSLRRRSSARRRSGSSIGSTASSSAPPVVRAVRLPPRDDTPSPPPTSRTTGPLDLPQLAIGDWVDHDDVPPPPPPPPVIAPVVPAAQPDRPAGSRRLLTLARYAERSSSRAADPPSMAVHAAA